MKEIIREQAKGEKQEQVNGQERRKTEKESVIRTDINKITEKVNNTGFKILNSQRGFILGSN